MRIISIRSLATSAAVGAMAFAFSVAAPASASAASPERLAVTSPLTAHQGAPVEMQRRGYRGGGFRGGHRGRGFRGPGGAAIGLGIAGAILGAGAAAAAAGPRECWIERRWVDTPWGPEVRRVRVCD